MPRRRLIVLLVIVALFVFSFLVRPGINFLTDWWWFKEIGYQVIFTKQLITSALLFLVIGGGAGGLFYLNLWFAQRGLALVPFSVQLGPGMPAFNFSALLRRLSLPVAIVLGFFFGLGATGSWDTVLLAMHRTPFGLLDPIFSRDIGFYVFTLPAISVALGFASGIAFLTLLMLVPVYWLRGDIVFAPPRHLSIGPRASTHVGVLAGVMLVLTALRLWLVDAPSLLYSDTGPLIGASYTDLHATLPAIYVTAVLALIAAVVIVRGSMRGHLARSGLYAVGGYILAALLGRGVYPVLLQKLFVAPTELTRETTYLKYHIAATRQAWGIDSVEVKELGGGAPLTLADIRANAPTITNVRLWDRDPLLQTFGQLQEIRTYYDFLSVDDDRYWVDGQYRQVLLSPRELNAASLPQRSFINEHLTFTHGMGLTLGPVNQVTAEGLPVLFIKDLPPVSSVSLKITRPQIYYGESPYEYVFTGTKQREFDHPFNEENVYAAYTGTGGVRVGGFMSRLVLAMRFGTSKILLSGDIGDDSKILYNRNIAARVAKALPFLRFDRDPYLVISADGTLKWILDAYTTTDRYPYSKRLDDGTTYMRNSVKVVLDAYDGSLRAYVTAPGDPLIRTWSAIFPGIFLPLASMPADLRAHLRYPDELFTIQTGLYTTYHMDAPVDFYQREDQWQVPVVKEADGSVPFMRHIIMRLPEEQQAEFVYMVPFTPRGKDNLAAWMVARNDGAEYGKLRVYKLSRQSLVFGPTQIENRINQNTEISQQVSLWDQRGSKVIRGDLLVIPIGESLLYVQPLYLQAEGGRIPELKRVVVAYQNEVVMQETLDGALTEMFGGTTRQPAAKAVTGEAGAAVPDAGVQAMVTEARRRYDNAMQAQREGDWAKYGEEIKALGQLIEQLRGKVSGTRP